MSEIAHPQYITTKARLKTFGRWLRETEEKTPEELSFSGFFHSGDGDKVTCFCCGFSFKDWFPEDNVDEEHQRASPRCHFIQTRTGAKDRGNRLHISQYPEYESFRSRLESFSTWPKAMPQKAVDLAETGMFYLKYGDKVCCHYCGVEINNWQADQTPVEEHQKRSPKCYYLRKIKNAGKPGFSNAQPSPQNEKCIVCKIQPKTHMCIPCGHMVTCSTCEYESSICPICQRSCVKIIKVFRV